MKIAILGGGVAGLSAAHELVERGHTVDVYEKNAALGGKARSLGKPGSGTGGRKDLPGEHGFRFFPGFYTHVVDTMQRIPTASGTVANNLVQTTDDAFAQEGKPLVTFPTVPGASAAVVSDYGMWFNRLVQQFSLPALGLTLDDAIHFAGKLGRFATSCDRRRREQYELICWWDFLDADNRSPQYQKVLAEGMTRSLVAMKAKEASTRTIGTILLQMVFTLTLQGRGIDHVLNAPTSDAWIDPWVSHLQGTGLCTFHRESAVESFEFEGGGIAGVNVHIGGALQLVTADHYIAALPVEVMAMVAARTPALVAAAPQLQHLKDLQVDWMNGIQFYLGTDIQYVFGHLIALDSPWALTCISQAQFWSGTDLAGYGDGSVKGVLSVDISDWEKAGKYIHLKPAGQCDSAQEVADECWAQLGPHFSATATPLPAQPHGWTLDPAILFIKKAVGGSRSVATLLKALRMAAAAGTVVRNLEPLLINTTDSLQFRPQAATAIPNLFLASDYVATNTDLACMEGANEAARRAVNALLDATGSAQPRCMVNKLHEPAFLDPFKSLDDIAYGFGYAPSDWVPMSA